MSGGGRADERVGELAEALTRLGPRTLTWPALCSRAGVDHSVADVLWRALEFVVREARTVSGFLGRIAEVQSMRWSSSRRWACAPRLGRRLGRTASIFIDLVDFTRASTGLDAAEFGRVLGRFKALAWDEITEAGGRLVKLVGDEAMFVAPADGRAADAALAILSQCGRDELPRARCGIAAGKVLIRGGDYFGPVVNLASRLVDAAAPDAVVLDSGYRQILGDQRPDLPVAELESRELKGIGPTELWAVRMGDVPRFGPGAVSLSGAREFRPARFRGNVQPVSCAGTWVTFRPRGLVLYEHVFDRVSGAYALRGRGGDD